MVGNNYIFSFRYKACSTCEQSEEQISLTNIGKERIPKLSKYQHKTIQPTHNKHSHEGKVYCTTKDTILKDCNLINL